MILIFLYYFYLHFYKQNKTQNSIWFHAVSLGEVIASEKIIKKLLESNDIVLSVTTPTGLRQAKKYTKIKLVLFMLHGIFGFL